MPGSLIPSLAFSIGRTLVRPARRAAALERLRNVLHAFDEPASRLFDGPGGYALQALPIVYASRPINDMPNLTLDSALGSRHAARDVHVRSMHGGSPSSHCTCLVTRRVSNLPSPTVGNASV